MMFSCLYLLCISLQILQSIFNPLTATTTIWRFGMHTLVVSHFRCSITLVKHFSKHTLILGMYYGELLQSIYNRPFQAYSLCTSSRLSYFTCTRLHTPLTFQHHADMQFCIRSKFCYCHMTIIQVQCTDTVTGYHTTINIDTQNKLLAFQRQVSHNFNPRTSQCCVYRCIYPVSKHILDSGYIHMILHEYVNCSRIKLQRQMSQLVQAITHNYLSAIRV